jgi:hypothetical protein
VDNTLRRNEKCIIGLPRCDFVFSSTRSCFIAYGFGTSALETTILKQLLERRSVEAVEAGGARAPGEHAFCVKICSKIITSQFCIVLLNSDTKNGFEVPNPNVNLEYGLMLGFNKYVIPFQRATQELPFNVAGLDTIKYTNESFEPQAATAIDQAISATTPAGTTAVPLDQKLSTYLLTREKSFARVTSPGDQAISDLGAPLGFNLLIDSSGTKYFFLGNFTQLRAEAVVWRAKMICRTIDARRSSFPARVEAGVLTAKLAELVSKIFSEFEIWLVVNTNEDRRVVSESLGPTVQGHPVEVISLADVDSTLKSLGGALA